MKSNAGNFRIKTFDINSISSILRIKNIQFNITNQTKNLKLKLRLKLFIFNLFSVHFFCALLTYKKSSRSISITSLNSSCMRIKISCLLCGILFNFEYFFVNAHEKSRQQSKHHAYAEF